MLAKSLIALTPVPETVSNASPNASPLSGNTATSPATKSFATVFNVVALGVFKEFVKPIKDLLDSITLAAVCLNASVLCPSMAENPLKFCILCWVSWAVMLVSILSLFNVRALNSWSCKNSSVASSNVTPKSVPPRVSSKKLLLRFARFVCPNVLIALEYVSSDATACSVVRPILFNNIIFCSVALFPVPNWSPNAWPVSVSVLKLLPRLENALPTIPTDVPNTTAIPLIALTIKSPANRPPFVAPLANAWPISSSYFSLSAFCWFKDLINSSCLCFASLSDSVIVLFKSSAFFSLDSLPLFWASSDSLYSLANSFKPFLFSVSDSDIAVTRPSITSLTVLSNT